MQRLFSGEVYDIIPKTDGLVFSYCKGVIDGDVVVGYKMISTQNGTITDVAKNIYLLAKFGSDYNIAVKLCDNYVTSKALLAPSGRLFVCTSSGAAHFVEGDGSVSWSGELKYRDRAPSDIALYKNAVWGCFAQNNVLIRFNPITMREELRIGGRQSPFSGPRDIFICDNIATISNAVSKTLTRVNLDSYTVEDYRSFEETLYSYLKVGGFEFVLLESGLYVL